MHADDSEAALTNDSSLESRSIIRLRSVTKTYGGGIRALDGIDLDIPAGVTGLLGPNGSGKSTLIKGLLGLLRFDSGQATVLGYPLPTGQFDIRRRVGYVPEDDCYVAGLTGIESVALMARLSGITGAESLRRSHEVLDFSDLAEERYRPVETYSTGMRQKLKFAQAMVHDPSVLIMDEPTTGLDPSGRAAMLGRIKTLATRHGKSILVSTHILHDVRATCDHVVIVAGGRVAASESFEVLSRPIRPGWRVKVDGDDGDLVAQLQTQRWTAARELGAVWLSRDDATDPSEIFEVADATGTVIRNLEPAKNSLEQIFLNVVRSQSAATSNPAAIDQAVPDTTTRLHADN